MLLARLHSLLAFLRLRRSSPWAPRTPLDWILYSPVQWLAALLYRNVLLPLRGCPFHPPSPPPAPLKDDAGRMAGVGRAYYYCGCGKGRPWFHHHYASSSSSFFSLSSSSGCGLREYYRFPGLQPLLRLPASLGFGSTAETAERVDGAPVLRDGESEGEGADRSGPRGPPSVSGSESGSATSETRGARGPRRPIRVVCLSDTHNLALPPEAVPDGDLLIHCGDLTVGGSVDEVQRQVDWLKSLPHPWKVVVGGNHDLCLDKSLKKKASSADRHENGEKDFSEQEKQQQQQQQQQQEVNWDGIEYLCDRAVELRFQGGRRLNVYGWGAVPDLGEGHALSYPRRRHPWHRRIPDETDVLVTHTPPAHHLDLGLGCAGLLDEVWRVKPRLHVFGHVHHAHGAEPVYYDECQRAYEAIMSRRPQGGPLRELLLPGPHWLDVWDMVRHGIANILWKWIMLGPGTNNGGLMVNAALMYGDSGVLKNPITVVDL
ncbi:hypothetical protein VTJ83DRAFT_4749 [Remersonia thermophila]|uniref:Calcineurin-like phosphoesterase domain-containing protein n=1 Tax=Remersonia thermophila TaxID=72144 RepID=A0ABR4DAT4_9PEZI